MPRSWIWLQLLLGWLPMGALFGLMVIAAHGGSMIGAALIAAQMMLTAALLGIAAYRFTVRVPWPHPLTLRFVATHVLAAVVYAAIWFVCNLVIGSIVESSRLSLAHGHAAIVLVIGPAWGVLYLILGVWLYIMVAGIAYANRAAEHSARIEALAARTQLATLRAQLHPHLLFNALHTVVQLIPLDPRRATRAAEELAAILRAALSEQRDVIPFADEWAFVQRYLAIESLRFGDRLRIRENIAAPALAAQTPAFALQTLVENAVRHAAAPRITATELAISAHCEDAMLVVAVCDDGDGAPPGALDATSGTGLKRLRERLHYLCGAAAVLELDSAPGRGFRATLRLPQRELRAARIAHEHADD